MKRLTLILPLLASACAGSSLLDPVGSPEYAAIGYDPFWMVAIGDDEIVLSRGPGPGEAGNAMRSYSYPRTLPHIEGGVRRYESEGLNGIITVEASPGPCSAGDDRRRYPDRVRVFLSGVVLEGCGGREVRG